MSQPAVHSSEHLKPLCAQSRSLKITKSDGFSCTLLTGWIASGVWFKLAGVRVYPEEWLRVFYIRFQQHIRMVMIEFWTVASPAGRQKIGPFEREPRIYGLRDIMVYF